MSDETPTPAVVNAAPPEAVATSTQQPVASSASDATAVTIVTESAPVTTAAEPSVSEPQPGRAQERIQDLVVERNAAKEYAEYWRSQALTLMNQGGKQAPQAQQPSAPRERPAPTLEEFKYDQGAWSKASQEWLQEQATITVERTLDQRKIREAADSVIEGYLSKVDVFKKIHPDYDLVTSNPNLPSLDKLAASMVLSSEKSADITYHLATNPEEAVRIARLPAPQQALAIGRLEGNFRVSKQEMGTVTAAAQTKPAVQATAPVPVVTKAPEPPTPIPTGGAANTDIGNVEDVRDWMKMRTQEARRLRRGRAA